MLLNHVITEVADERKGPIAHAARVRLLSLVSAHVGVTDRPPAELPTTQLALVTAPAVRRVLGGLVDSCRRPLREAVAADGARVQPLAGVDDQVGLQLPAAAELLRTDRTAMRPLVGVRHHVTPQPGGGRVGARTLRAPVRPPALVDVPDVLVPPARPPEPLPAPVALEPALRLAVVGAVGLPVRPQLAPGLPGPAAPDAEERPVVAVDVPVFRQTVAAAKRPAAVRALEAGRRSLAAVTSQVDVELPERLPADRTQVPLRRIHRTVTDNHVGRRRSTIAILRRTLVIHDIRVANSVRNRLNAFVFFGLQTCLLSFDAGMSVIIISIVVVVDVSWQVCIVLRRQLSSIRLLNNNSDQYFPVRSQFFAQTYNIMRCILFIYSEYRPIEQIQIEDKRLNVRKTQMLNTEVG